MAHRPRPLISDEVWTKLAPVIAATDVRGRASGRRRTDPRLVLEAVLYKTRNHVGWNAVPARFGDDSTLHRTYQRWLSNGTLAAIVQQLAELDAPLLHLSCTHIVKTEVYSATTG